jgi:hypothetical protein
MEWNVSISLWLWVFKKTEKPIKPRKPEKNNWKNRTVKKPIKILKKPTGSVWFWFFKPGTEKTEPNWEKPSQTGKKPSQNEPNRKKPSQTGLNRFLF